MCTYGTIMSVLIPTMIGKHHLKLDMPGEFSNKVLQKCLTTTNIYDDIRGKLTERGIPAEQVRFIHEATTDAQKKELFAKVRSGEVRVLLGSTPKMGAGTNVQDRLIAIHNLDCPWRPSDVGRILRTFKIKKNVEVTDNGKIII